MIDSYFLALYLDQRYKSSSDTIEQNYTTGSRTRANTRSFVIFTLWEIHIKDICIFLLCSSLSFIRSTFTVNHWTTVWTSESRFVIRKQVGDSFDSQWKCSSKWNAMRVINRHSFYVGECEWQILECWRFVVFPLCFFYIPTQWHSASSIFSFVRHVCRIP